MSFKTKVTSTYTIIAAFADFHPKTQKWLVDFLNGHRRDYEGVWKTPPLEAIHDLEVYQLEEPETLYRGLFWAEPDHLLHALDLKSLPKPGDHITYDDEFLSSWSKSRKSAAGFTEGEEVYVILKYEAKPKDSLLDVTRFEDIPGVQQNIDYEQEVVLKPGRYQTTVERVSESILDALKTS